MLENFWAKNRLQEPKNGFFFRSKIGFFKVFQLFLKIGSKDFSAFLSKVRGQYGLKTGKNSFLPKMLIFGKIVIFRSKIGFFTPFLDFWPVKIILAATKFFYAKPAFFRVTLRTILKKKNVKNFLGQK